MKPTRAFVPLILLNLKALQWIVWFIFTIGLLMTVFFNSLSGEQSGFEMPLQVSISLMYCLIIGLSFFIVGKEYQLLPHAEFLLSLPVSRRSIWLTRTLLYFILVMGIPFLNLCISTHSPDTHFLLYSKGTQHTEAAEKLPIYQAAFPASFIEQPANETHRQLIIPRGNIFLAGWQFFMALLAALAFQVVFLPRFSGKQRGLLLGGIMLLYSGSLIYTGHGAPIAEPAFFFFAHHCIAVALLFLGATMFVQIFAWHRIKEMEAT